MATKTNSLRSTALAAGFFVLAAAGTVLPPECAGNDDSKPVCAAAETSEHPDKKKIVLTGFDALAHLADAVTLRVKLETSRLRKDIEDRNIDFYVDDTFVGSSETDDEGLASLNFRPEKEGNFDVVYKLPPPSGYRPYSATALLAVWTAKRPILVTDLDYTIIDMSKYRFLDHDNEKIPPIEGALEKLRELSKLYNIIYLTARDDIYLNVTKEWLAMYGFPRGPVFFCDLSEDPLSQGKFKEKTLRDLKAKWPNIKVGVGDKVHDAKAYIAGGIKAFLLGEHKSFPEGTVVVNNWSEIHEVLTK